MYPDATQKRWKTSAFAKLPQSQLEVFLFINNTPPDQHAISDPFEEILQAQADLAHVMRLL